KEARSLIELGRVARLTDDVSGAIQHLDRAMELLGDRESIEVAEARRELAMCISGSDASAAISNLRSAAAMFERSEEQTEYAATCRILGDLLAETGNSAAAMEAYRRGILAVEEKL
ncbi:MAG: hypothetical protein M3238_00655, partial [Actinomycetota bacterium]|nr:hypothetical protein [Actinomycetota bacterium]